LDVLFPRERGQFDKGDLAVFRTQGEYGLAVAIIDVIDELVANVHITIPYLVAVDSVGSFLLHKM
jgi:hypothetical protein